MRPQELNLLVIFDHIMTEKSITRAAEQLSMTQPAVSNAVSRMRTVFKDDLFVKDGRNIQPTSYAKDLWLRVRGPLHQIEQALSPQAFDPATIERTFRIAVTDYTVDTLWLPLRQYFEQQAPNINLHAIPYTIENAQQVLDDAEVDLVFSATERTSNNILSSHLLNIHYVCVMRKDHPLANIELTPAQFAAADHLLVSLSGDSSGPTDEALNQLGLSRRIAMTVNNFASATPIIANSNLIAILPEGTVQRYIAEDRVFISPPPVEIPFTSLSIWWHKRQDKDAGLIWLKQQIKAAFHSEFKTGIPSP